MEWLTILGILQIELLLDIIYALEVSFSVERSFFTFFQLKDWKVLSTPTMVGNGAIVSVDSLETLTTHSAAFSSGFLEVIFTFKTC